MYRFHLLRTDRIPHIASISIHPMYRFHSINRNQQGTNICISIHPMYRFHTLWTSRQRWILTYFNTSYVSVPLRIRKGCKQINVYFNTSYVSVPQVYAVANYFGVKIFQYILCIGSTHSEAHTIGANALFQYILCIGSTDVITIKIMPNSNFNTSYVSVPRD